MIVTQEERPQGESESESESVPNPEQETFEPFTEFPTPKLLREANEKYAALHRPLPRDDTGKLLPYPTPSTKASVFDLEKFQAVDKFAVEVRMLYYNFVELHTN